MGVSISDVFCATHWRPVGRKGASRPPERGDLRLLLCIRGNTRFLTGNLCFRLEGGSFSTRIPGQGWRM